MNQQTIKVPRIQYRAFSVRAAEGIQIDGRPTVYPLSFSSEEPIRTFSWDSWEEYDEILSHKRGDIDLSYAEQGLPMLKAHRSNDHMGSVNDIRIQDRRLTGMASFSSIPLGQEQETLLREGHLKTVSVGYEVTGMELVSKDKNTGIPTYRCSWIPREVSTTPFPADRTVGFNRARAQRGEAGEVDLVELTVHEPDAKGECIMETQNAHTLAAPTTAPGERTVETAPAPPTAPIQTRDIAAEAAAIMEMAQAHGMTDKAAGWIRAGRTPDQVGREILAAIATVGSGQPAAETLVMAPKDRARYSYQRSVRMQIETKEAKRGSYDGLEGEVHQELTKERQADHGGILVPWGKRTLGTTEPTGGSVLVGTQIMPEMIDLLRNKALVLASGAQLLTGLTGNIQWNKKTGAPTVSWMAENPAAGAAASEPSFGYVTASPKTMIGRVQIPRQLIVQSSIDHEADTRADLATGHALAFDLAALHGSGVDSQPVGIYSAADVQSYTVGGIPDLADVVNMPTKLATVNADMGAMSFMTTPAMAGLLMRTVVVTGQAIFIWVGSFREGTIFGWPARATNQCSSTLEGAAKHAFIFANWNDLAVCMWGNALELVVDPYTKADFGQLLITSYSMGDVALKRPASFVKGTGATIV
jgi:HK97 family phage major capsid protein